MTLHHFALGFSSFVLFRNCQFAQNLLKLKCWITLIGRLDDLGFDLAASGKSGLNIVVSEL